MGISIPGTKTARLLLTLAVVLLLAAWAGCSQGPTAVPEDTEGVAWYTDFSDARDLARAESKPIMINFYTDICPACQKLDRMTFADDGTSDYLNANFVNVKSNAGKSQLHAMYDIENAVPTTIFATSDGVEMGRIRGFVPPDRFRQGAEQAFEYWAENYGDKG